MFELISVLMCRFGGGGPAPAPYIPPPAPKPVPPPAAVKQPQTAVRQKQRRVRGAETPLAAGGFGGTLLTGTQGLGDEGSVTGKSMLGG